MTFIRFLYNTFFRKFLNKSFTLNDFYSVLNFINEIKSGRVIDNYEISEIGGSQNLAGHINNKDELLPTIVNLINDRKRGVEIKQCLYEHRHVIHAMFYNKEHIMTQLSKIINELEATARMEEERNQAILIVNQKHKRFR